MHRRHCRPMNFPRLVCVHSRWSATLGAGCLALLVVLSGCSSKPTNEYADWSPEKLFSEAKSEQEAGNYEKASKMFDALEGKGAGTLMSQQALLEGAYLRYLQGERAPALATIERFIKLYPSSPGIDYALYLKGLINFNDDLGFLGKLSQQDLSERDQLAARESFQAFKQLVEQYPDSRYTAEAQVRMDYISNMLAAYEVHVARYYYRRGAYVASANRAQQAIQEFQQSPSTEEALSILWHCYEKLGLDQLRDDAERVFRTNYPDSELLTGEGLKATKRSWWQVW